MTMDSRVDRLAKRDAEVLNIALTDTVETAAIRMSQHQVGCLIVTDEQGRIVGILSERDIIAKVVANHLDSLRTRVMDVMTRKVIACTLDTPIPRAQQIMAGHNIRHLPIVEDGRAVGMISARDIMAYQLEAVRAIARRQQHVLSELEQAHPGISQVQYDQTGRIVI